MMNFNRDRKILKSVNSRFQNAIPDMKNLLYGVNNSVDVRYFVTGMKKLIKQKLVPGKWGCCCDYLPIWFKRIWN
jgi:hypothetical protein